MAATQIGVAKQVAVIDISPEKNEPLVIVNPAIQILDPTKTEDYDEGFLSVPGFFEKISRPSDIKLTYQDLNGKKQEIKPEGLLTKVVQHELDHLNGRLFVDHISELKEEESEIKLSNRNNENPICCYAKIALKTLETSTNLNTI